MKKFAATVLMLIAALFLLPSCASTGECSKKCAAGNLKIGWGKRSIAMPGPVPISGQFHLRVSQGEFTPVLASALVLENGKDAVIFVSCDVVSVNPKVLMETRRLLKKEIPGFPVEKLIINATHTHAGPSTNDNVITYPNKVKIVPGHKVQKFIARQIADAVKEAWNSRKAGSVAYGYGFATTGHSRRATYLKDMGKKIAATSGVAINGKCIMYGRTNLPEFDAYEAGTDPFINLLYTFDCKGKLTGAVINVPCPSQTSESAWAYNASFWHNVREKLEAKYGCKIGVIAQSAAGGDLAPRQLHYKDAEMRRYMLKYKDKIAAYIKKPMARPAVNGVVDNTVAPNSSEVMELMRAEDIANRIVAAFDEVLSWAGQEKFSSPVLKHQVKTVKLAKRSYPKTLVDDEKRKHAASMKESFITEGDQWEMLMHNSRLNSRRRRMAAISTRYAQQKGSLLTDVHAVRIGNIAFATNRFELFMDYQHRIQGRSPFEQTFIVQLVTDPRGTGSYLATARGERNKGYSATPHSNLVSYRGGQQLVNETIKMLNDLKGRKAAAKKNPKKITVPRVKGIPAAKDWQKGALLKNFCSVKTNAVQEAPTAVRMLHDGKFLYVKVDCGKAQKDDILLVPPVQMAARDGAVWKYESIEFFIARGDEFCQFAFSAGSKLMDLTNMASFKGSSLAWSPAGVKLNSKLTPNGWQGVFVLPLKDLKFAAKGPKDEYKFNIYRTNSCRSPKGMVRQEAGAYLHPNGAFKNISAFGTLRLAK